MVHQNSDSSTKYDIANKRSAVKVYFWDPQQQYGFINIDPAIINGLNIDSETILTQEITEEGILLRRFTKNRSRPAVLQQPDDQDYGE